MSASARSISPERDLPSEEDRERLLDALTTLVRRMGFESLVSSPLVVGTREFFPEPVPGTVGGLRGVLRRLLVFAGLSELQPAQGPGLGRRRRAASPAPSSGRGASCGLAP